MKKVLYLGGFFQAEFSMRQSFIDNGVEICFLIDDNKYTRESFWINPIYQNYSDKGIVKIVPSKELFRFVDSYKPDVIVNRHYLYNSLMYSNAWEIAMRLVIPYVHLEMELSHASKDTAPPKQIPDFDMFLYAHDYETPTLKYILNSGASCYFYPYGVSSFERSMPEVVKDREIGGFGYPRFEERERCSNLNMFTEGLKKLGKKMHVYGDWNFSPWVDYNSLIVHLEYRWEEATRVMNRHKIAINFETISDIEGAYSHKMFQTIGCGVPTLTFYKNSLFTSEMFGRCVAPRMVECVTDVVDSLSLYLNKEDHRKFVGEKGERFIHENFDWFKRFDKIMKKEGVW